MATTRKEVMKYIEDLNTLGYLPDGMFFKEYNKALTVEDINGAVFAKTDKAKTWRQFLFFDLEYLINRAWYHSLRGLYSDKNFKYEHELFTIEHNTFGKINICTTYKSRFTLNMYGIRASMVLDAIVLIVMNQS